MLPPKVIPVHFRPPSNMATIDHLRNRSHDDRHEPNPQWEERTVLACWQCNNDRNRGEMLAAGLSEQQRKTATASREKLIAIIREQSRVIARLKRALTDHGLASEANRIKVNRGTIARDGDEWRKGSDVKHFDGTTGESEVNPAADTTTPTPARRPSPADALAPWEDTPEGDAEMAKVLDPTRPEGKPTVAAKELASMPDLAERIAEKLESVGLLDVTNPGDFVSQSAREIRPLLEPLERDAAMLAKLRELAMKHRHLGLLSSYYANVERKKVNREIIRLLEPQPSGNSRPSGIPE